MTPPFRLDSALKLAREGFHVFPVHSVTAQKTCSCGVACGRVGKHPRTKHGFKEATRDEVQIKDWFRGWPDANIGIACGPSRIVVIDVDPRNDGETGLVELQRVHGDLPRTRMVCTGGGGWHYYFAYPDGIDSVKSQVPVQGVEIKAAGAYVIAPPSGHVSGSYIWDSGQGDELAPAPYWIVDLPVKAQGKSGPPIDGLMGRAFVACGMQGPALGPTKMSVQCPWEHEHTGGTRFDSSTVVFGPSGGAMLGWFHCSHAHCQARSQASGGARGFQKVVLDALDPAAVSQAKKSIKGAEQAARALEPRQEWENSIKWTSKGDPAPEAGNLQVMLENMPEWRGTVVYDEARDKILWARTPPDIPGMRTPLEGEELSDAAWVYVSHWFSIRRFVTFKKDAIQDVLVTSAKARAINSLRNHLDAITWDGKRRLNTWLTDYCGAASGLYTQFVGRAWMVSTVARAFVPGCQVDHVLVLEGKQGMGKTSVFRILGGDWYTSFSVSRIDDKDARMHLHTAWIVEIAELASLQYSDMVKAKAFLTERIDRYRPPYGRFMLEQPRRCVFGGSTNESDYIRDATGARRFWPVKVDRIDLEGLARDRNQLIAEAIDAFKSGVKWWPLAHEAALLGMLEEQQESRMATDPWEQILSQRYATSPKGSEIQPATLYDLCGLDRAKQDRAAASRIGAIMRKMGFERTRTTLGGDSQVLAWIWIRL